MVLNPAVIKLIRIYFLRFFIQEKSESQLRADRCQRWSKKRSCAFLIKNINGLAFWLNHFQTYGSLKKPIQARMG